MDHRNRLTTVHNNDICPSIGIRELHNLYSSPNTIRLNKSNRKKWGGGMWHARESQKERDHSEDRGVDGRMGSEWILGRLAGV
jgi:hypothetical protein